MAHYVAPSRAIFIIDADACRRFLGMDGVGYNLENTTDDILSHNDENENEERERKSETSAGDLEGEPRGPSGSASPQVNVEDEENLTLPDPRPFIQTERNVIGSVFRNVRNSAGPEERKKLVLLHYIIRKIKRPETGAVEVIEEVVFPVGSRPPNAKVEQGPNDKEVGRLCRFILGYNAFLQPERMEHAKFKPEHFRFGIIPEETLRKPFLTNDEFTELLENRPLRRLYGVDTAVDDRAFMERMKPAGYVVKLN